jgi:hypothetical protein
MDASKASYWRRAIFLLFRRTEVRRNDRKFVTTNKMKSFYDAIKGDIQVIGHYYLHLCAFDATASFLRRLLTAASH